jgi:hypothetical protein
MVLRKTLDWQAVSRMDVLDMIFCEKRFRQIQMHSEEMTMDE